MSDATQWTALLLDKQKMQAAAEREKHDDIRRALTGASQSIMGGLSAMGAAGKQKQLDDIANRLMNEEAPPVATAVDPEMQKAVMAGREMAGLGGSSKPATGGVDEMKFKMAMEDQKMQRIASQLRQQDANQVSMMRQQAMNQREQGEATQAFKNSSKELQEGFNDSLAYYKTVGVGLKQAAEAATQEEYNSAAAGIMSMYKAAQKRGLEIDPPNIPAWMSPEQKSAQLEAQQSLTDAEARLEKMKGDWWPNLFGADEKQQALVDSLRKEAGASPAASSSLPVSRFKPGDIINQGGQKFRVNSQGAPEPL